MINKLIQFFYYFRDYLGNKIYLLILLSILASTLEGLGIFMFMPLIDSYISNDVQQEINPGPTQFVNSFLEPLGLADNVFVIMAIILIIFIIKGVFIFFSLAYSAHLQGELSRKIRYSILDLFTNMNFSYYSKKSAGHFVNLINDQVNLGISVFSSLVHSLVAVASLMVYVFLVFTISWKIGLYSLGFVLVVFILFKKMNLYVRALSHEISARMRSFHAGVIQFFKAFRYLKATGQQQTFGNQIQAEIVALTDSQIKKGYAASLTTAIREPVGISVLFLISYFSVEYSNMSQSGLMVALFALYRSVNASLLLQSSIQSALSAVSGIERIQSEQNKLSSIQVRDEFPVVVKINDYMKIEFKNVTFQYDTGDSPAINDLSITINRNEFVALVGASGSGKTTILNLLLGLVKPEFGSILIDGTDLAALDPKDWAKKFGYVSQESVMFSGNIYQNVTMDFSDSPARESIQRTLDILSRVNLLEFVESLSGGLFAEVGEAGILLSGGQQQRLFIARELYRNVAILILDESTSALDSHSEYVVRTAVDALRGLVTVIIVSHREDILSIADKIYVIDAGTVKELGSHDELEYLHK